MSADFQEKAQSICPGDSLGKHRTSEGCLCYRIADALADAFSRGAARLAGTEKSREFWRTRYSEQCALYHDAAKERDQALANHADVVRKKRGQEGYVEQVKQAQVAAEAERDAAMRTAKMMAGAADTEKAEAKHWRSEAERLRAIVHVSACPNCGGTYRLPRNGSPCDYRWHDLMEAGSAPALLVSSADEDGLESGDQPIDPTAGGGNLDG